ncbi:hypothetical protein QBC38DRAFT_548034 [Podospora fimiseda]|uniref:Copper acquisition factor BIM1-like domain-containing protein n=1 Tax=Podospora fimiseda TaxID=252190 RepID=A0AAN7GZ89_9PEZI|nr:hypothetical protein QBC38DRAFT_548034 [Podospora fimiseda]
MTGFATLLLLSAVQLATAHFGLEYPEWRDNTLSAGANSNYSQWEWPCAGVPPNTGNRTDWPLTGGSVKLDLHHKWTYIFINLGIGANVSNFNVSLTNPFWNSTGNGTLCVPKLTLPSNLPIDDGTLASIQVVTIGETGNALYNCADITFRSSANALSGDDCKTSDGITYQNVTAAAQEQKSAASSSPAANTAVLSAVGLVTLLFVFGMSA